MSSTLFWQTTIWLHHQFALHFMDIHIYTFTTLPFTPMPLSLFRNTYKLKKTHHLIVAKCWCMNELIITVVNLAQRPKHIIQVFAWNPLTSFSHCQGQHFHKVRASVFSNKSTPDKLLHLQDFVKMLLFSKESGVINPPTLFKVHTGMNLCLGRTGG